MNAEKVAHLSWVRAPIESYVERCKQAMVNIIGLRDRINTPPPGAEPVWFVNQKERLEANQTDLKDLLSGISYALRAVSSNGGYALASEIRTLGVVTLETMSPDAQDRALLAIQSALNVLPSYISMVVEGAHDSPGVLLKYINELRGLRDVPAIADDSALPLNFTFLYKSPPLHESDVDLTDRERTFKKAASQFCLLYTDAMKGSGDAPWLEMREHLRELQRVTNDPELGCYWWVGEAIIDVIIADNCYFPPAMTTALRVVMVATQRLPQGEQSARQTLSASKFSNLLNALSISRKQTATSVQVITHFDVKQNVEEGRIAQLQEQLATQNVQSIVDVLPEIQPRLESAMIAFGRAAGSKHPEGFAVQTQAFDQAMRTIANIFGIFNEAELSELSFHLADTVKGLESADALTPEIIDVMKTQILFLDSKLNHMQRNEAADLLQIQHVNGDVVDRIAVDTYSELQKVRRTIATHVDSGIGPEKLLASLDSLQELARVFEFAGSLTIANILAAIVTVITGEVDASILGESEKLTLAARALVSVEMYLQYITSKLHPPTSLIEQASAAVRSLGLDVTEFRIVSRSDLLSKFESSTADEDGLDALLSEISEIRPIIEEIQKDSALKGPEQLNRHSTACLRLSAAAMIVGEKKLGQLCRYASELAKVIPGRVDDTSFDSKKAMSTLIHSGDTILRCMDDYSSKGKVNLFLVEIIREVAELIGHSTATPERPTATPTVPALEISTPQRQMPEEYNPTLQQLFAEEFAEQLVVLRDFLGGESLLVTERVCRAIHNTHGCSGSASCFVISTLFDVLESRFYAMKAAGDSLSSQQAQDFAELLTEVEEYQQNFPWVTETNLLPVWIEIAGSLTGLQSASHGQEMLEVPLHGAEAAEVQLVAPVNPSPQFSPISDEPLAPENPHEEPTNSAVVLGYELADHDFYLVDADEVIPELQRNIQSWMSDMTDKELMISIRRNMHTLKGAAGIIKADGIKTLTHHMESLFDCIASGAIAGDKTCADLATFVVNELVLMTDAVRNQQPYRTLPALNDFLEKACEISRVDELELAAVIQTSYGPASPNKSLDEVVSEQPKLHLVPPSPVPAGEAPFEHAVESIVEVAQVDPEQSGAVEIRDALNSDRTPVKAGADIEGLQIPGGTRRGYRGMRDRATGERQRNYDARQVRKNAGAESDANEAVQHAELRPSEETTPAAPADVEVAVRVEHVTGNVEVIPQVLGLIQRAAESSRDAQRTKRTNLKSEKIKVELQLLDNSVKQTNELKASTYRQTALFREMMLSIVAIREKLSLHQMHHTKSTVLLRNFNNMTSHSLRPADAQGGDEGESLYLERFNLLSYSSSQSGLQIEQLVQDAQDIITQSNLMDSGFKYQREVVAGLQRDLLQSRLVLFDNEKPSLTGAFTAALQQTQKKASLEILGADTRIDRQLLESIRDPLRHSVNNAVAHGIETEIERIKAGKPPSGKVVVRASRRPKSVVITITDDGRGIDPNVIRSKAIQKGLIKPEDVLSEQQTLLLITESGFSTADTLSELSGRGVGMDIVRSRLTALGGHLRITSQPGSGTTMELELPLTVDSNRAIVCKVSDQWYAIPTYNMIQVLDFPTHELMAIKAKPGQARITFDNKSFDVVHLADLIALPDLKLTSAQAANHTGLVLIEQGSTRLAIEVENGISMPEIHVTKFEGILSSVQGIIGSTEIHDGTPALVLDVIELARLNLVMSDSGFKSKLFRIRRVRRELRPLVLIVDDSNSFQKLLTRHFEGQGWEVASAHNGQDALDKLPTLAAPALFVVDVEMPKMNGLELTERLRSLREFDDTPIIMLTTRSNLAESAKKAGVNQFLSKPYDAVMLNEAVRAECPDIQTVGAQ